MNRSTQQALQALSCCITLPCWVAITLQRSYASLRARPRWAARIRTTQPPAPVARPRLPRRSA
ncbi:hypothetical protein IV102_02450 [bacterium]|nr:hypothetical protein [bacterium]